MCVQRYVYVMVMVMRNIVVYKTVLCFGMDEIPVIMDDLVGRVTQPVFKGINNLKDVVLMSEANIENGTFHGMF